MKKTLGDYIVLIISIIGSLASIIAFGVYFSPFLNHQGAIGVIFLGLIALLFIGYTFYLISKYRKRVRYGDIFEEINVGFTELHAIDRHPEPSIELIIQKLGFLCDNLSNAFTTVNGNKVGVCIKFIEFKGKRPLVTTLVRDRFSKSKNRKTGTADKTEHFIELNSDFQFIWENFDNENIETSFYHEKHLPTCKDYKNSRLSSNWKRKYKFDFFDNYIRRKDWPLPYRSTLVVPIVPLLADEQNQESMRGFLCIDSPREGMFNPQIDVDILKGISDGLYNKIDKLKAIIKQDGKDN
ncbi:MAG TPA: hypothetical protein DEF18_13875 [Muricauda sp.]|nr:hypothetical protein [uncultured Allomuricauda sp.]MBC72376.1 hypothetical protein [Allomuricauda sp.]HBU79183.1 hypothetical protein [Allomuricauda sp.]|tara:strand:- start:1703 stop:2590 length:888 start_codon:yes stop_codon:yes gene_type:complete